MWNNINSFKDKCKVITTSFNYDQEMDQTVKMIDMLLGEQGKFFIVN